MKKLYFVWITAITTCLLLMTSSAAHSQTNVGGEISANTTWTAAGNPYLVNSVSVKTGVTLTIEAGTILKFKGGWESIDVYGTIKINGTAQNRVVLTTIKDDSDGRDSNGDGNATTPQPGDWGGIWIREGSTGNLINYSNLNYGGGGGTSAIINTYTNNLEIKNTIINQSAERGIYLSGCSPDIHDCSFSNNLTEGVYIAGFDTQKNFNFYNNSFSNNTNWAVLCNLVDNKADITLTNITSTGSSHNGFGLSGYIAGDAILDGSDNFPFIVSGGVGVRQNAKLSFTQGTILKFEGCWDNLDVYGTLTTQGTLTAPVVFTSLNDDTYGGDTNGNGSATGPNHGDWSAVWLRNESSGNIFNHTFFRYGGGCGSSGIFNIFSGSTEFNTCKIDYSDERGIYSEKCSPSIHDCSLTGNKTEGIYFSGFGETENLIFSNNTFSNNVNWAVMTDLRENKVDLILTGNSSNGSAHNGFGVTGYISDNAIFDGNDFFPFIVNGSVIVRENMKLTITAGTGFKFNGCWDNINVYGTIEVNGNSTQPVYFTSLKDDSLGGDTNSDAGNSSPVPGDWSAVWLQDVSKSNIFNHSVFRYGGGCNTSAIINNYSPSTTLNTCDISYSDERGIYSSLSSPDIHDCSFTGNLSEGIHYVGFGSQTINFTRNTFTNNVNWAVIAELLDGKVSINTISSTSTGSAHNGFGVIGNIAENATFAGDPNFPFIIYGSLIVNAQKKLTVSPGTGFKMNGCWDNINVYGTLDASGTSSKPIYFTSLKDDSYGGDSNGDLNQSSPVSGDWSCVWIQNGSTGNNIKNASITYAGGCNSSASINVYSSGLTIENSLVSKSDERGLYIEGSSPTIKSSIITLNKTDGIFTTYKSLPILTSNQISGNTNYGIYNADGSVDVDARNTWWGSSTGPYHPTLNTGGLGNKVTDHVLFNPWKLTTALDDQKTIENQMLGLPYPNPVKGTASIPFEIKVPGRVLIQVVNSDGKIVETLLDEHKTPGSYEVSFDSSHLPNSTYLLRLVSDKLSNTCHMVVIH